VQLLNASAAGLGVQTGFLLDDAKTTLIIAAAIPRGVFSTGLPSLAVSLTFHVSLLARIVCLLCWRPVLILFWFWCWFRFWFWFWGFIFMSTFASFADHCSSPPNACIHTRHLHADVCIH